LKLTCLEKRIPEWLCFSVIGQRDFYDIHVLLKQEVVTVDRAILKNAFYATSMRRESTEQIATIDDVINKIADDGVMRQQWNNYRKTNYYVGDLEWDDVIGSAKILRKMIEYR